MKSALIVLLATAITFPSFAFAEETSASAGASSETTVTTAPDGTSASSNTGAKTTVRESPSRPSTGNLRESPTLPSRPGVTSPRDSATGQATGKRVMAADVDGDGKVDIVSPRDAASGLPTGKRQYQPIIIRKVTDAEENEQSRLNGLPPGDPMGKRMQNASGTMHEKMGERMDEAKERMGERKENHAKEMARKTIQRMAAAIARIEQLATRVDSRLQKLAANGRDVSTATPLLAKSREKLAAARIELTAAEAAVTTMTPGTGTSTMPSKDNPVRMHLEAAKTLIHEAHKALEEAVSSIKGSKSVTASTSAAVGVGAQ